MMSSDRLHDSESIARQVDFGEDWTVSAADLTLPTYAYGLPGCKVYALDAAMPFDFEAKANARLKHANALRIGIVGFGTFGQFLAKRLVQCGHKVLC